MDLLLHVCCGPCASVAVPDWRETGHTPRALFFNPNIEPQAEYERRLAALHTLAVDIDLPVVVEGADDAGDETRGALAAWRDGWRADGPADREGRCRLCIVLRLFETARRAAEVGAPAFATSLAVSPYQSHEMIREAGAMAAATFGVEFVYRDQRPLFRRQFDECRRLGLYRQSYCGCALSKWEAWHDRRARRAGVR
jgi:predicted adenine nucleotide alpha hydrolase (AANH) superfamily ATPase